MRSSRIALFLSTLIALAIPVSVGHTSNQHSNELADEQLIASYHGVESFETTTPDDLSGGIKEEIPAKYQPRYRQWKEEFLSTDAGRNQWNSYQNNSNFTLHITVTRDNAEGATTGKYKWNDDGQLVSATITLGMRLDEGYPNPIYFPVMNSLVPTESANRIGGDTLAATKLAHE